MNEAIVARTFKTEWFAKAAKKADISDADLCKAIEQVRLGQCDNLGGGVFKKRLNKNRDRSIVIAKGGNTGFTRSCLQKKTAKISPEKS